MSLVSILGHMSIKYDQAIIDSMIGMENFYPIQYKKDNKFPINHNYLSRQFSDYSEILEKIKEVVLNNDFTLGRVVDEVEELVAIEAGTKYAIAVGSGTDAIFLSLKALGIGEGDEVITTTYTFYATVGAIVTAGAKPVFCDCGNDFNIDVSRIESLITRRTKAIVPVHWSGRPCEMDEIRKISSQHSLYVIEDACHALQAEYKKKRCGSFGETACFSFHPLKNLNVWGDGGIITTSESALASKLKLIRNHGLTDRDTCVEFSYNSRLDSIQAVVAKHVLDNHLKNITASRIGNAQLLDSQLSSCSGIKINTRCLYNKEVFHLYMLRVEKRDELIEYLKINGVDAKIHYPTAMHLQPAAKKYGYSKGDFPVAENLSKSCVSLPVHEFIRKVDIEKMSDLIHKFYKSL